jgi:NAD(P)-dependent dehydrogenase (short-subunit alcohol dehydrogenase family)
VHCDAEDPATIEAAVDATLSAFGRLDVLHNNAALLTAEILGADTTAVDIDLDVWDRVMAVNVRGYLAGCKYAIPAMTEVGGGSIICTASAAGLEGDQMRIAYGCSKGAIMTLVKYVATQYGDQGIRCNAVAPGLVKTEALMTLAPQFLDLFRRHLLTDHIESDDVAALVAWLASDEARRVTGQVITLDAGYTAHGAVNADMLAMIKGAPQPT